MTCVGIGVPGQAGMASMRKVQSFAWRNSHDLIIYINYFETILDQIFMLFAPAATSVLYNYATWN